MKLLKNKRSFREHISKWHSKNVFKIKNYDFALISTGFKHITKNQAESCRKVISRTLKAIKTRPVFHSCFNYNTVITKKADGARMGRGKGMIKNHVSKVFPNSVLFVFQRITYSFLRVLVVRLENKLPIKLHILNFFGNGYCRNKDRCLR